MAYPVVDLSFSPIRELERSAMTSQKQIIANQNNAKLSTGPRTAEGKAQIKYNALKHGFRSAELVIMPNEDPAEYAARVDSWIADYQPTTATEENQVRHAAKLSWLVDRAFWREGQYLSQQMTDDIERAERDHLNQHRALLRKLLPTAEEAAVRRHDYVDVLKLRTRIEASAEGCDRLLNIWRDLRASALTGRPWNDLEELHAVHLLGFGNCLIRDPGLIDIVVANRFARDPAVNRYTWSDGPCGLGLAYTKVHEALERKPANITQAFALMVKTAEEAIARLEGILADRERDGDLESIEAGAHVVSLPMYDANVDVERTRKYRESLSRELRMTIATVIELKKEQSRLRKERGIGANKAILKDADREIGVPGESSAGFRERRSPDRQTGPENGANEAILEVVEPEDRTIRNPPRPAIVRDKASLTRAERRQRRRREIEAARQARRRQLGL
jgi:hypothetical protein